MVASTTFVFSLFFCCTIAQTTNIKIKGAAVTTIPVPSPTTTLTPPTVQQSTTTPPTVQHLTTTPQTVQQSTTTPPTVQQSTTTPPTVQQSTTTPPTVQQSTTTPPTVQQSTTTPPTVQQSTTTPPTVQQSTTTPLTVQQSTTTPPTVQKSTTTPSTVQQLTTPTPKVLQSTTTPPTLLQSTTTSPTVQQSTTTTLKVQQSTTTPTTVPQSTTKSITTATRTLVLEFKCAPNGFITDISGVDKGEVVLLNGSNYCHLNEASCDWKNKTKLNVLHVKGEKSSNIAGGKNAHFYQLECKTAGAFVASANTSMNIAIPAPTDFTQEIKKPTEPTNTIKLVITDKSGIPATKVHIGDPLLLKITGPAGYTIEPISCAASSSLDKDYVLWTNKSCSSKDTAVIEDDWKHNTTIPNMVSISMYGFRFVKSNTVVVTCSALFCPIGLQCSANPCVNGKPTVSSRRRRNADQKSKNVYLQESVSTSFTVVDNRIDTSGCSGSFVSVFTYVTACALLLALK